MVFGASKQLFAKTLWFQEKRRPETYKVEFVDTKQVTLVRAFSSLLVSVINLLPEQGEARTRHNSNTVIPFFSSSEPYMCSSHPKALMFREREFIHLERSCIYIKCSGASRSRDLSKSSCVIGMWFPIKFGAYSVTFVWLVVIILRKTLVRRCCPTCLTSLVLYCRSSILRQKIPSNLSHCCLSCPVYYLMSSDESSRFQSLELHELRLRMR